MFDTTLAHFGRLDVLVNNAGAALAQTAGETTEVEWDRMLAVNLESVFPCSRAAVPPMRRTAGGGIVNVAFVLGLVGSASIADVRDPDGNKLAAICRGPGRLAPRTGPKWYFAGRHLPPQTAVPEGSHHLPCLPPSF